MPTTYGITAILMKIIKYTITLLAEAILKALLALWLVMADSVEDLFVLVVFVDLFQKIQASL